MDLRPVTQMLDITESILPGQPNEIKKRAICLISYHLTFYLKSRRACRP
jgi:hypothetical protein